MSRAVHTRDVGSSVLEGLSETFKRAAVDGPESLWHASSLLPDPLWNPVHVPYWIRKGFQKYQGWGLSFP